MQAMQFVLLALAGLIVVFADDDIGTQIAFAKDLNQETNDVEPKPAEDDTKQQVDSNKNPLTAINALKEDQMTKMASAFVAWLKLQRGNHGVAEEKLSWIDNEGKGHAQTSHTVFKRSPRNKKLKDKNKKKSKKNKKDDDDDDDKPAKKNKKKAGKS